MKKTNLKKLLGAAVLSASLAAGLMATGVGAYTNVSATLSPDVNIVVDGVSRTFYAVNGTEVHPISYNGTTYLPVRAIGELMGKVVTWDQSTLTVGISGTRTEAATVGSPDNAATAQAVTASLRDDFKIIVDGVTRSFQNEGGQVVYPILYNGSVYLPVRSIGELMGKVVTWDQATKTVNLSANTGSLVTDADSFGSVSSGNLVTDADSFGPTTSTTKPTTPVVVTPPTQTTTTTMISAETAKAKAYAHAGVTAAQVAHAYAKLDWENGRQVYDVEFYTSNYAEYDYEIDAYSGAVLSFDYDAEHLSYGTGTSTGTATGTFTLEQAKSAALKLVPGATTANIRKAYQDWDDGRTTYEIEIIYNYMEYDFEYSTSGTLLERDVDSVWD